MNLEKSEMISMGEVDNSEELTCDIGCKVGKWPTSYLGLPLGAPHKSLVIWDVMEETTPQKREDSLYFVIL